jgi:hypothetical protein
MKIEAWGFKPHRKSHHYIIRNYRTHCLRNTDASRALASFSCLVTPVSIPNPHTCLRFNFGPSTLKYFKCVELLFFFWKIEHQPSSKNFSQHRKIFVSRKLKKQYQVKSQIKQI